MSNDLVQIQRSLFAGTGARFFFFIKGDYIHKKGGALSRSQPCQPFYCVKSMNSLLRWAMKSSAVLLLFLLAACAADDTASSYTPPPDPMVPEETNAQVMDAVGTFEACMAIQAHQIDDHVSSASVIATSIEGDCQKYWPAVIQAHIGGLDQNSAEGVQSAMENDPTTEYRYTLDAVLYERSHPTEFASGK